MTIKGNTVTVNASQAEIFAFLGDSNNIIHLLPKDKISDFKSTDEMCSFKVQGGVMISLVQDGLSGDNILFMKSGEKSPFPFRLTIKVEKVGDASEGYIQFDGEVNAFLKMMVERPLTNLFNYMSDRLQKQFSE
ncbi:MAG: carbon monoxide dehydrogenase subunit G [Crocinitomicaceae bacterium]|jgi:carbon monoxide dehydrogenase subunit G